MKKLSQIITEHCVTSDVNPGNSSELGVSNHYTPIGNIVTNVKNFFSVLGIVVAVAEDGVSLKIHSTKFVSEQDVKNVMNTMVCGTTLEAYITQQGLDGRKLVNLGMYYVLYCSPTDIKSAQPGKEAEQSETVVIDKVAQGDAKIPEKVKPVKLKESLSDESELSYIYEANADDDEEIKDLTKQKVGELISSNDKVKAAKQLELLVRQEIELPNEFYFAGVTSSSSKKSSIALRWKYTKRTDVDVTTEITKSLINIHGGDKPYAFVPDFNKDSHFELPEDVKKLIDNIIEFLDAEKTNDECKFDIKAEKKDDKKDDKSDDKKDDSSSDKSGDDKGGDLLGGDSKDSSSNGSGEKKDDSSSDDLLG